MDQLKASEQYVEDDKWSQEGMNSHEHVGYNFVEMTNLPKKIEAVSIVVQAYHLSNEHTLTLLCTFNFATRNQLFR